MMIYIRKTVKNLRFIILFKREGKKSRIDNKF